MKELTRRSLRVMSMLGKIAESSGDIRSALLPFFEPFIIEQSGRIFDINQFVVKVKESYRWNFNTDIAEEFIGFFLEKGWLSKIKTGKHLNSYLVKKFDEPEYSNSEIENIVDKITDKFIDFLEKISPLNGYLLEKHKATDILIEWLLSIDGYDEGTLNHGVFNSQNETASSTYSNLPSGDSLTDEEKYLCATFVKSLFDTKSPYLKNLYDITKVGLITELVRDFHKPHNPTTKSKLIIYLDSPLALELLEVSGKEAHTLINNIVEESKNIGCTVCVFEQTIEEMQRILKTTLASPTPTGPTAEAIKHREIDKDYVRHVAGDPAYFLKEKGIQVGIGDLDAFPHSHQYFTKDLLDDFYSKVNWNENPHPRNHDASMLALIMRKRERKFNPDIFVSNHIFVTRNTVFVRTTRHFCIENKILRNDSVPPIIHRRQLAMALWLRTGNNLSSDIIPCHMILTACERVRGISKNMLDKVQEVCKTISPSDVERFEMLIKYPRSAQILQEKTLNNPDVLRADNTEKVLESMESAFTEKATKEKNKEIKKEKKQKEHYKLKLDIFEEEDLDIVRNLLDKTNCKIKHYTCYLRVVLIAIIFALIVAGYYITLFHKVVAIVIVLIVSALFVAPFFIPVLEYKKKLLDGHYHRRALSYLRKLAKQNSLLPKVDKYKGKIKWNSEKNKLLLDTEDTNQQATEERQLDLI